MIVSEIVFACHSKACAPPPVGSGGSKGGGAGGRRLPRKAPGANAAWDEVKRRSDGGEKMTRGKIREAWVRNTGGNTAKVPSSGGSGWKAKDVTVDGFGTKAKGTVQTYQGGKYRAQIHEEKGRFVAKVSKKGQYGQDRAKSHKTRAAAEKWADEQVALKIKYKN